MGAWLRQMFKRVNPVDESKMTHGEFVALHSPATRAAVGVASNVAPIREPLTDWQDSIKHVLLAEGGYVDHPKDPGKCTNRGITIGTLRGWRDDASLSCEDVKRLTESEAREIYRALYWNPVRGDDLGPGVSLVVFDMAVNAGVRRASQLLQGVLRMTNQDGVIGPQTLRALGTYEPSRVIRDYSTARLAYYRSLRTYETFGKGWANRTEHMEALALMRLATSKRA